jgi:hypothetical protein
MSRWTALLAALCLFAGLEATYSGSVPWGTKTLRYQYQAQVVTGIKELSNNVAGIGIKATLLLESQGNQITLKLENIQLGQTKHDKLESWQTFHVPMSYEHMTQEARVLAMPITASYVNGQIHEVKPSHEDPIWSVNIKRAILTLLNVQLKPVESRMMNEETHQDKPLTYTTMEDGIGGFCHTFYVIHKAPHMETTHVKNTMRVTKTRDYKNCLSRPKIMTASHPVVQCSECDSDNVQLMNNGDNVNYEIVGHPTRFVIKEIAADGYTTFAPYTSKADELTTMHRIILKLEDSNRHEILQEFANQEMPKKTVFDREWRQENEWDRATIKPRNRRSIIGGGYKHQQKISTSSTFKNPLFRSWRPENYEEQQNQYENNFNNKKYFGQEEHLENEFRQEEEDNTFSHKHYQGKQHGTEEDMINQRWNRYESEPRYYGQRYQGQQKNYGQEYYGQHYGQMYNQKQSPHHYMNQQGKSSLQYQFPDFIMQEMREQDLKKPNPKFAFHHQTEAMNVELHQVEAQLHALVQSVVSHNEEAFVEAPLQYLTLIRQVRYLNYEEIMQLVEKVMEYSHQYNQEEQREHGFEGHMMNKHLVAKRLLTDIIAACGTNPAVLAIKTMIERQLIKGETAYQAIQAIPTYVIQPSAKLIQKLMELTETPVVREDKHLYKTLLMTLGELIGMTTAPRVHTTAKYVARDQMDTSYKYIHELISKIHTVEKEDVKAALIQALGQTGHPEIIPVLAHYAQDKNIPTYLRVKAIYSLHRVSNHVHHQLWTLLRPIFRDTTEQTEVRIAAFDILLSNSDPNTFLERVAAMTWYEPDQELVSYIYSTLKSLSAVKTPCYKDMTQYAKVALDVAKPVEGIHKSKSVMLTTFAEHFGLGANLHFAYIQGRHSVIPRVMHIRLGKILANHWFQPLQATVHAQGIQTLLNKMMGPDAWFNKFENAEHYFEQEGREEYSQQQDEDLKLKHRHQEPFFLSLYMNFFGTQNRQFHLDQDTLKKIVSEFGPSKSGTTFLLRALESGYHMHMLSAMNVIDVTYQIPNPTGLPMMLQIDAPTVVDFKTMLKANGVEKTGMEASLHVVPRISTKLVARMGVYAPYLNKFFGAGIKVSGQTALPFTGELVINQENKMMVVFKPHSKLAPKVVPYVRFQVLPFTFANKLEEIVKSPVLNISPIQKRHMIKNFEHDMSHLALGAPIVYIGEHEMPNGAQRQGREYEDKMHTKTFGGFLKHLSFFWATPVATYRHYELRFRKNAAHEMNHQLVFTVDLKSNPVVEEFLSIHSQHPQQKLLAGIWTFLSGWSKVPAQCDTETTNHYSQYKYSDNEEPRSWRNYLNKWTKNSFHHKKEQQDREIDQEQMYEPQSEEEHQYNYRTKAGRQYTKDQYSQYTSRVMTNTPAKIHKYPLSSIGSELKIKAQVLAQGEKTFDCEIIVMKESPLNYRTTFQMKLNPEITHSSEPFHVCGNIHTIYPKVPCHIEAIFDPRSYGKVVSKFTLNWGKQTCQTSNHIQIETVADKSEKQLEKEEQADTWYFRQCQKDHKQGTIFSRACHLTINDLSSLNRMNMQIRHTKLPTQVRDLIYQLDALIKAAYHPQPLTRPHLINDHENELFEIVAEVEEGHPLFNVYLIKPVQKILYRNIHSELLSTFTLPIPTRSTHLKQAFVRLTQGHIAPRCHINGNTIKSFDENIMKAEFTPCKYVLAKDCSTKQLFTVYARPTGESHKNVEVRLLNHLVVLPSDVSRSSAYMIVDGQKHTLEIDEMYVIKSEEFGQAIAFAKFDGAKIVLKAPHHGLKVVTDGKHIKVEVSNMWKGRVCGICGEMIKNKKSQLMGPNKCIQPNPQALVESYMVEGQHCQKIQQHERHPVCLEEGQHKSYMYNPFQKYFTKNYQSRQYVHQKQNNLFGHYGEHWSQMYEHPTGRFYEHEQVYGPYNRHHFYGQMFGKHNFGQYGQEYQTYGKHPFAHNNYEHQMQYGQEHQTYGKHPSAHKNYEHQMQYGQEYQTYGKYPFGYKNQQSYEHQHQHQYGYGYKPMNTMFESEHTKGLKEKTVVKEMEIEGEHKTCFSMHPVNKCKFGYTAINQEEREVRFHCLPTHLEQTRELLNLAERQVLYQMAEKQVTVTKMVSIHKKCVSA